MGVSFKEQLKALATKTGRKLSNKLEINGDYGDTSTIVGLAKNLESEEGITLSADVEETSGSVYADEPFSMRPTAIPFDDSVVTVTNGNETIKKVNGFTIVKNQLIKNGNFATSGSWSTTRMAINGNVVSITEGGNTQQIRQTIEGDIPIGHKLLFVCVVNPSVNCNISVGQDNNGFTASPLVYSQLLTANTRNIIMAIGERKTDDLNPSYATLRVGFRSSNALNVGETLTFDFVNLIDLTMAFQSRPSIAAGLEGDSGCQWFLRNFPEYTGYVDFNLGVLKSVSNFTYKTTGINLWNEDWERGSFGAETGLKQGDPNRIRSKNIIKVPTGAKLYGYTENVGGFRVFEYDANGKYIIRENIRNREVQLDALCCYVNIDLGSSADPVTEYNNDTQLCLKWTETTREQAYHPRTEQEISIDWSFAGGEGKSVPGGISDYKDFVLRKNHKRIASHTFTESDTLSRIATGTDGKWRCRYVPENAAIRPSGQYEIAAVLIDGFIAGSNIDTNHCVDNTVTIGTSTGGIVFYKEDLQTVEDMKAFLIGKTLYYALETEIVTDMDDSERNIIACDDYGLEYLESESDIVPAGFTILYQDNLKRQITNNANAIGELLANMGDLSALTTADKRSIVNAINKLVELNANKLEINGDYGDTSTIVGLAKNLESEQGITLSADVEETSGSVYADEPFLMRPTAIPFDDSVVTVTNGNETIKKVNGFTVVENQLIKNGNFATSGTWSPTKVSISGNVVTITDTSGSQYIQQAITGDIPIGHKLMFVCAVTPSVDCNIAVGQDYNGFGTFPLITNYRLTANRRNIITVIGERKTSASNPSYARLRIGIPSATPLNVGDTLTFDFIQLVDLTKMFQSRPEIAIGLEGNSGCQWFLRNFPEFTGYVDFNLGGLKSVSNFTYKTTGINLWDEEWEQGTFNSTTGDKQNSSVRIRSKNFIKVPVGATLYGYNNNVDYLTIFQYDANGKFISYVSILNRAVQISPLCCYVNIVLGSSTTPVTEYQNDTQLSLHWTETARERAYHPHTEQEVNIDWSFAGGEGKCVNGVCDYKDYVLRKNYKCIGSRAYQEGDEDNVDAYLTDGTTTYYVLEDEIVTDMDDSERNIIACDDYGLEYIESTTETAPAGFTILYQDNLKRQITNNANAIGELSENIGDLSALRTIHRNSIVMAINELVEYYDVTVELAFNELYDKIEELEERIQTLEESI